MNHPITGAVYPPHYHDAPGQHQPIDPDAPNPHNAVAVERLKLAMNYMRQLHKPMQSVPMGQPSITAREQLIQHLLKEAS